MDAAHFREQAARAREMAQWGDDFRLSRMLLELATDMDAEAAAIEGGDAPRSNPTRRFMQRSRPLALQRHYP